VKDATFLVGRKRLGFGFRERIAMDRPVHKASQKRLDLPQPDADSAAHSAVVAQHIARRIAAAGGSISFAEYMHEALYAPGLGYYTAGSRKFGAAGDFITAPEISPLFGFVLARQAAAVLRQTGGDLLEPGAGSGALAVAMLRKLAELDALPERYLILEVSADLRERQLDRLRRELPDLVDRVCWIADWPGDFTGVVVSNEVADALPVERFRMDRGCVQQGRVVCANGLFGWTWAAAPSFLEMAVRDIETGLGRPLEDGYESEVAVGLHGWIGGLAKSLRYGMIFLVDYGVTRREYYTEERTGGWLRCHFRHHAHDDPLVLPGIQDITSWVDFSQLAEAAVAAGLEIAGYATQADFLLHGGLEAELANLSELPPERQIDLSRQVKLLTLPSEMGENFKCIALRRGDLETPPGWRGVDRMHRL